MSSRSGPPERSGNSNQRRATQNVFDQVSIQNRHVIFGKDGRLYGTTYYGGSGLYFGTVFRLTVP